MPLLLLPGLGFRFNTTTSRRRVFFSFVRGLVGAACLCTHAHSDKHTWCTRRHTCTHTSLLGHVDTYTDTLRQTHTQTHRDRHREDRTRGRGTGFKVYVQGVWFREQGVGLGSGSHTGTHTILYYSHAQKRFRIQGANRFTV